MHIDHRQLRTADIQLTRALRLKYRHYPEAEIRGAQIDDKGGLHIEIGVANPLLRPLLAPIAEIIENRIRKDIFIETDTERLLHGQKLHQPTDAELGSPQRQVTVQDKLTHENIDFASFSDGTTTQKGASRSNHGNRRNAPISDIGDLMTSIEFRLFDGRLRAGSMIHPGATTASQLVIGTNGFEIRNAQVRFLRTANSARCQITGLVDLTIELLQSQFDDGSVARYYHERVEADCKSTAVFVGTRSRHDRR